MQQQLSEPSHQWSLVSHCARAPGSRPWLVVDACGASAERSHKTLQTLIGQPVHTTCDYARALELLEGGYAVVVLEADARHAARCKQLVETALRCPRPAIVVVTGGEGSPALVAELMLLGAAAYLQKPLRPSDLSLIMPRLFDEKETLRRVARMLVGRVGLKDAQWLMRGIMGREALARTGSRRAAAVLLDVDRRYIARLSEEFRAPLFGAEP